MVVCAVVLAGGALAVDGGLADASLPGWAYSGGADGARAVLSTVAGSMVTVAGVGFSITIVALVLASTQFGPRLLTLFMRDVTSQATLGTFTGTFTFCILVLRTIRGADEGGVGFVPQVAVTVAIGLALVSVAVLIYFFHHVAISIQAPNLVAAVARDLDDAIDRLGSRRGAHEDGPEPAPDDVPTIGSDAVIASSATGYLQIVDDAALLGVASRHDLCVRLLARPGLFLVHDNVVFIARPRERVDERVADQLRSTLIIGDVRTPEDDIEFSVRQLVEVALRGLSPAINDPFTAMAAVDWLGAALSRLARADFPSRYRYDDAGHLRVVADISTFGGIAHTIFSRIRHYGGTSPVLLNRLLEAIAAFGGHITDETDRELVRGEADAVLRVGRELITSDADVRELERRYAAASAALASPARG